MIGSGAMSGVKNRSASCPKLLKFQQSLPDVNLLSTSSVMLLLRNLPFDLQCSNITSLLYFVRLTCDVIRPIVDHPYQCYNTKLLVSRLSNNRDRLHCSCFRRIKYIFQMHSNYVRLSTQPSDDTIRMSVFSDSEKVSLTRANYAERFFTQKISLCTLICLIYLLCHGNCLCYVRAQNTKCYRDVHLNRTAKACDNTALTKLCFQGQGLCQFSFLINFLISEFVKG